MNIDEVIERLTEIKEKYGNLDCKTRHYHIDGYENEAMQDIIVDEVFPHEYEVVIRRFW